MPVTDEDIRLPVAQESNNWHRESLNHVLQADLNEAAGAADASRAMLRTLCLNVAHPIAVLAYAHFLSTAKPTAYRWTKRLNSH